MKPNATELVLILGQQSKVDLKSAYELYERGDYGNAAFHTQQALEKAFKCVMMKYGLAEQYPESLKQLGHRPYIRLFNLLKKHTNNFNVKNKTVRLVKSSLRSSLPHVMDMLKGADASPMSDKVWWKISLGVNLSPDEAKKALRRIRRNLDGVAIDIQKIKNVSLEIRDENSEQIFQVMDAFYTELKTFQDMPKSSSVKSMVAEHSRIQTKIRNILHNLFTKSFNHAKKSDKEIKGILTILPWITMYATTILKIMAHEQISRYPEEVNGMSSSLIYEEKADQLYALMQEVEESIKELYEI